MKRTRSVAHGKSCAFAAGIVAQFVFLSVCLRVCGRLLINTYVHISNIFASVCCQFAAAPLCAVNYFCCLQLPPSYWQIHKHFATICFPFCLISPLLLFFCYFCSKFSAFHVDFWAWFEVSRFLGFVGFSVWQLQSTFCGCVCQCEILCVLSANNAINLRSTPSSVHTCLAATVDFR